MPEAVSRFVRAGRASAAKRWGNPANRMVVRLDSLTVEQKAVVLALVRAAENGRSSGGEDAT
jgi:hypothetical protein